MFFPPIIYIKRFFSKTDNVMHLEHYVITILLTNFHLDITTMISSFDKPENLYWKTFNA